MKQLTEQQITDNWKELRTIINNTFSGDRLEKLNKMYDDFEDRMVVAPASAQVAWGTESRPHSHALPNTP